MSIPENSAASLMGLRAGTCEGVDGCTRPATTSYGGIPCCSLCKTQLARECASAVAPLRESAQTALARAAAQSPDEIATLERYEAESKPARKGLTSAAAIVHAATVAPVVARPAPAPAQPPAPKPAPVVVPLARPTPLATVSAPPPKPPPAPMDYAGRPQNRMRVLALRPDADRHPELCRVDGCNRPPVVRGCCNSCWVCLKIRPAELRALILLPCKPRIKAGDSVYNQRQAPVKVPRQPKPPKPEKPARIPGKAHNYRHMELRPDADAYPDRCRVKGCDSGQDRRGTCFKCYQTLRCHSDAEQAEIFLPPMFPANRLLVVDENRQPGKCKIKGCNRKPDTRGMCQTCRRAATTQGVYAAIADAPLPAARRFGHDGAPVSTTARVEVWISTHPGATRAEVRRAFGRSADRAVKALREAGRVRPADKRGHPGFGRLYLSITMDKPMDNTQQPASK